MFPFEHACNFNNTYFKIIIFILYVYIFLERFIFIWQEVMHMKREILIFLNINIPRKKLLNKNLTILI